jgi:CRP-like cAMP-binding protein
MGYVVETANIYRKLILVSKELYNLPLDEDLLHNVFKYKLFKKTEFLCMAGDIPDYLYFIYSGLIRFFYIDYEGNEHIKDFFFEDQFASSYASFLYRLPSPYYIEALEDTHILQINYKNYISNIENNKYWAEIARKTAEYLYFRKEKKESSLLLEMATERYLRFLQEFPVLQGRLKQKDIASYLNITPESLSRIKKELEKK